MQAATSMDSTVTDLGHELRRTHLRAMLNGRLLEERLRSLYRQGLIHGGVYLGFGQEAFSAAGGCCLQKGDVFAPLIRDMAGRLAFGETVEEVLRTYLGKRSGAMRGRDGNIHRGSLEQGILPMISHLGAMLPTAAGILLARRLRGASGSVGLAAIGDGAMACGATHEALNAVAVHRLPLVVMVANNGYSYSSPNSCAFACDDLVQRAEGYGIPGHHCDATDPKAALATMAGAITAARETGQAQLVVGKLLRLCGHGEHDDGAYMDAAQREAARDCLSFGPEQAVADGILAAGEWDQWRQVITTTIDTALATVEAEPDAEPAQEDWQAWSESWPGLEAAP